MGGELRFPGRSSTRMRKHDEDGRRTEFDRGLGKLTSSIVKGCKARETASVKRGRPPDIHRHKWMSAEY